MAAQSNATNAAAGGDPSYPSSCAAWYSVAVLMLMYIFSFIDRTTISLLVEPMKRDLHISDTQIGMLQGLAFALLYTFLGLPIARLSDRHSRRAIIAGGVFIWSIMATLCGLARTATQLFLARVGVGVGEAALSPAAYSIITDSFPLSKLGSAFGVYNVGITIGAGTAFLVGGIVVAAVSHAGATYTLPLLGEIRAWQMVFIVTGAPGIVLPLLMLTFREPARRGILRRGSAAEPAAAALRPPLSEVLSYVWSKAVALSGKREELPEVIDPKPGYVWDPTHQDPGSDGWGHYPKSGRALVYAFPNCKDGRMVADVVKMQKGHTEGYEPNVTDKIIELAVSAKGGKIAAGSWTPPPPPPPRGPFG